MRHPAAMSDRRWRIQECDRFRRCGGGLCGRGRAGRRTAADGLAAKWKFVGRHASGNPSGAMGRPVRSRLGGGVVNSRRRGRLRMSARQNAAPAVAFRECRLRTGYADGSCGNRARPSRRSARMEPRSAAGATASDVRSRWPGSAGRAEEPVPSDHRSGLSTCRNGARAIHGIAVMHRIDMNLSRTSRSSRSPRAGIALLACVAAVAASSPGR